MFSLSLYPAVGAFSILGIYLSSAFAHLHASFRKAIRALRPAWNKGRIVGQKRPLKPKHVWAIRVRLELAENHRDLALFNLAIDSKLRGCDLVKMKVVDVMASGQIKERASVLQSKTQKPVRFEISEGTRASLARWMREPLMVGSEYLWPGRFHERLHISTRQYARIVRDWVTSIGLEASAYEERSARRIPPPPPPPPPPPLFLPPRQAVPVADWRRSCMRMWWVSAVSWPLMRWEHTRGS